MCLQLLPIKVLVVGLILNKGLQSLLQIILCEILPVVHDIYTIKLLRWDEDAADDLDDTITDNTILDDYGGEGIDLDADDAAKPGDINAEGTVFEGGRQVNLNIVSDRSKSTTPAAWFEPIICKYEGKISRVKSTDEHCSIKV